MLSRNSSSHVFSAPGFLLLRYLVALGKREHLDRRGGFGAHELCSVHCLLLLLLLLLPLLPRVRFFITTTPPSDGGGGKARSGGPPYSFSDRRFRVKWSLVRCEGGGFLSPCVPEGVGIWALVLLIVVFFGGMSL